VAVKFPLKTDVVDTHPVDKYTGRKQTASDKPSGASDEARTSDWTKPYDSI
jgi:hypothetical protein